MRETSSVDWREGGGLTGGRGLGGVGDTAVVGEQFGGERRERGVLSAGQKATWRLLR